MSKDDRKQDDKKQIEQDLFIANTIYPEAEPIFTFRPKTLEEVKDNCVVVIDTNALLVPYATSKESIEQIRKTYKTLVEENRLIIPGQVAREFARNRANKISELYQQLSTKKDGTPSVVKSMYPLLESFDEYKKSLELADKINSLLTEYKGELNKILNRIQAWIWDDPVSLIYGNLFRAYL